MDISDVGQLSELSWAEFEEFAVDVLARLYREIGIDIKPTPFQSDGGRDAEGIYIFGPASMDEDALTDLEVLVRLWVEVKKSGKRGVDLKRVSEHVILATNARATKLILVTNGSFVGRIGKAMQEYCGQSRLSCALIDGERLLRIHRRESLSATGARAWQGNVSVRFTADPQTSDRQLSAATLRLEPGEPLFIILDAETGPQPPPAQLEFTIEVPGVTGTQPVLVSSTLRPPLLANERFRLVYVFHPQAGTHLRADAIRVALGELGPVEAVDARGVVEVRPAYLTPVPLPSVASVEDAVRERIHGWMTEGGIELVGIRAPGGTGKSHLLRQLRREWLAAGPLEITIDGGVHTDADRMFRRIVGTCVCLPPSLRNRQEAEPLLRQLLHSQGLGRAAAEYAASQIVAALTDGVIRAGDRELAETAASVVVLASATRPVVVSVEDLHKLMPSSLQLLLEMLRLLRHDRRGNVLFIAASRPYSMAADAAPGTTLDPLQSVFDLLEAGLVDLPLPSARDAIRLLTGTVTGLDEPLADYVIRQVGTSPFSLKEVVAFLEQKGDLKRTSGEPALFEVRGLDVFAEKLRTVRLSAVTRSRLEDLQRRLERRAGWLADFLAAGALLGRSFPLDLALQTAGAENPRLDPFLERELFRWDVLRLVRRGGTARGEFNHDIIRAAVLQQMPAPVLRRLAGDLVDAGAERVSPVALARLAYGAGDLERARSVAGDEFRTAQEQHRLWDALEAGLIAIAALDPGSFHAFQQIPELMSLAEVDEALRHLPEPDAPEMSEDRRRRVYEGIVRCISVMAQIGVGRSHGYDALVTEAAMLAAELGDGPGRAELEYYRGNSEIDEDNFDAAAAHHLQAEQIYDSLGFDARPRVENLYRLFLCKRQMNDLAGATACLLRAERLLDPLPVRDRSLLLNYRGYASLYVQPELSLPLWRQAYETALEAGDHAHAVECLLGCGYMSVLLDDPDAASRDFAHAETMLNGLHLETHRLRLHLDRGALNLVRGRVSEARLDLEAAARACVKYGMFRQMWRTDANLATVWEAAGDPTRAYAYDVRSMAGWRHRAEREMGRGGEAPWLAQRHVLPVVNAALRAREGVREYQELLAWLPSHAAIRVDQLVHLCSEGDLSAMPGALGIHFKMVAGRRRAIVTE